MREKTYPPGCEEHLKRAVRQAHTSYTVDKEQLMYTTRFAGKKKRIVTTLRERMALLKSTHVDTDGNSYLHRFSFTCGAYGTVEAR